MFGPLPLCLLPLLKVAYSSFCVPVFAKGLFYFYSSCSSFNCEGMLGVDEHVRRGYCADLSEQRKVVSILALAEKAGMSTGIVTTTRVSHATPASSYASSADRNWEADADIKERAKDDGSKCKDIGNCTEAIFIPYW